MSETDKAVRVLTQAVEISKQLMDMLENDKRQLLDDLDFRRNLYAELKKSEVFWRKQCAAEERKSSTTLLFMFLVSAMAVIAMSNSILNCQ